MKQIILLFGVCTLVLSCGQKKKEEQEAIKFLVTSPLKRDTLVTKDYVSQIHSIRHIELRALEKGYLKSISVDEGQLVKKGQPMFKISPNVYKAELDKAKAESDVASIEYKNTKMLADSNIVSANELAMAKAEYNKTKAEVTMAETHLGFTNIKAPFEGIMDHLHVREGSLLDEGELLTTLSDNSKMWVYFNVPEAEYLDYITSTDKDSKKEVSLMMANNRRFNQKGIIETIEGEFNNETGNIAFRATFDNPDRVLRHGETGSVIIDVPYKEAILIPQKATFEILDKKYVFVVDDESVIHQQEVTIAAELPQLFVIEKGLKVSDKILLEGIRMVKNGEKIELEYEEPESVLSHLNLYAE